MGERRKRSEAANYDSGSLVLGLLLASILAFAAQAAETFETDPAWQGRNNRPSPERCATTVQDFGYDPARQAAGGLISRSLYDAHYAHAVGTLDLTQSLSAHGTFRVPTMDDGSAFIGWFNDAEGSKPANFVGFRLMAQGSDELYADPWVWTGTWRGHGTKLQLPIDLSRQQHSFKLDYNPAANSGAGAVRIAVDGNPMSMTLPEGFKADGASFNRFGIFNTMWSPGATIRVYLDDVRFAAQFGTVEESFDADPGWQRRGNRITFTDCRTHGNHDFGWADGRQAIGGLFWRTDPSDRKSYYAERINTVTFDRRLEQAGTITFTSQMVDSGVFLGWFNEATVNEPLPRGFLGLLIEGLTSDGHFIRPVYVTNAGNWNDGVSEGPTIRPDGRERSWRLVYEPRYSSLTLTFEGTRFVYHLAPAHRREGATMNRFGIFPYRRHGGGPMEVFIDNLERLESNNYRGEPP